MADRHVPEAHESLEFVKGSHLGPMDNTSAFDSDDDTKPILDDLDLPDIEAERDAHAIVSWAVEPGDVVVFHATVLHGGQVVARGGQDPLGATSGSLVSRRSRCVRARSAKSVSQPLDTAFGRMLSASRMCTRRRRSLHLAGTSSSPR